MTDKIVLITGAGSGIGRALAEALAARGALVAAVDINPLGLDKTVARIRAAGGRVKEYVFDVAKRLPIVALVQEALDDWGRIDVLINAAEVAPCDAVLDMDEWDFHRTLDVNLAGPFFLMQRVGRVMQKQGGGTIVNVGADKSAEGPAYVASKAGLEALTRIAEKEFAAYNIQVRYIADFRLMIDDLSSML